MTLDFIEFHYLKIFTGVISVLNPLGVVPVFLGLTSARDPAERKSIARTTAFSTALILMLAAISGQAILDFFGISISSFRMGGGILILLMAISMLHAKTSHAKHTPDEAKEAEDMDSIAVVPLAIPMLAGPGAISAVIVYAHEVKNIQEISVLGGVILLSGIIVWSVLRLAVPIGTKLGKTGINIIVRIMGLLLAAIAVEFMAAGLKGLFPSLG